LCVLGDFVTLLASICLVVIAAASLLGTVALLFIARSLWLIHAWRDRLFLPGFFMRNDPDGYELKRRF
jgi:hypothetical protein